MFCMVLEDLNQLPLEILKDLPLFYILLNYLIFISKLRDHPTCASVTIRCAGYQI